MKIMYHTTTISLRPGVFPVGIVMLSIAILATLICYIYAINSAVVDAFATQRIEKELVRLQEDISRAEGDLARLSIGSSLEERAMEQGLVRGGPGRFISRETSVAQAIR